MLFSAITFSMMAVCVKILYISQEITSFAVMYWKSFLMVIFQYVFTKASGHDYMGIPKNLRTTMFLRALFGFGGFTGLYTSLKLTSLSKASMLFFTNPIITAVYARIFLKEKISYYDWVAIFCAFFGVILLQNPFGKDETEVQIDSTLDTLGSALALFGAFSAAFAFMLMRKMAGQIYFMLPPIYFTALSTGLSTPGALYQMSIESQPTHYTSKGILLLLAISFLSFLGQISMSRAYQLEKAGRVAPVNNVQLVCNVLFDVFILGSKLTA